MTNRLKTLLAVTVLLVLPAVTWAAEAACSSCASGCCPLCC